MSDTLNSEITYEKWRNSFNMYFNDILGLGSLQQDLDLSCAFLWTVMEERRLDEFTEEFLIEEVVYVAEEQYIHNPLFSVKDGELVFGLYSGGYEREIGLELLYLAINFAFVYYKNKLDKTFDLWGRSLQMDQHMSKLEESNQSSDKL